MVGAAAAGDAGSRSILVETMSAGPLGSPISAGSMLRPASAAQGGAPCASAPGAVGPTQRPTRAAEAIAATTPERRNRQHGIRRNVIGLLLSMDVSPSIKSPAYDLMFPVRITLAHFSVSSATNLPKS